MNSDTSHRVSEASGCGFFAAASIATFVLVFLTNGLLVRVCLRLLYPGVEFYHSSESRGTFHLLLYNFALCAAASLISAAVFVARRRRALASRHQLFRFIFLFHGLIWLAVSILFLLILVFYELPHWDPIRGG